VTTTFFEVVGDVGTLGAHCKRRYPRFPFTITCRASVCVVQVEIIYAIVDRTQHRDVKVSLDYIISRHHNWLAKQDALRGIGRSSARRMEHLRCIVAPEPYIEEV
jgi:hypothetical protein